MRGFLHSCGRWRVVGYNWCYVVQRGGQHVVVKDEEDDGTDHRDLQKVQAYNKCTLDRRLEDQILSLSVLVKPGICTIGEQA